MLLLVVVLGTINPVMAIGGLLILGLFAYGVDGTYLFFDLDIIAGIVVAIVTILFIEYIKSKK